MARSADTIKAEIQVSIRTFPSLDSFLFPSDPGGSDLSFFNVLIHSVATSISVYESVLDAFNAKATELIQSVPVHNTGNTRQKILNFQFGDTIVLDADFVPAYTVPDDSKKIITQCAVTDSTTDVLTIKVAKGTAPNLTPLTAPELAAVEDYYFGTAVSEGVGVAGVSANFLSDEPDRFYVLCEVFYLGQFDATAVKTEVIEAMTSFLSSFQDSAFNGEIFMNRFVDAIQVVAGVSRVNLDTVRGRPNTIAFPGGTLVDNQGTYKTFAGYAVEEDETGNTFDDTVTMILETLGT